MSFELTGRRSAVVAVSRAGLLALSLTVAVALSACTTVEGTNAMTDVGTFEREVMTSTLQGLSLVPKEQKDEDMPQRGPLVLPKDAASLPAPQAETASLIPEDSDNVRIDTASLSEDDMKRLRNARVVDLRSLSGRPLTEAESKALTARMLAANKEVISNNGERPLYLPPEEYFTTIGGKELICLAANGELVALNDQRCPAEIRAAMRRDGPDSNGSISDGMQLN